MIQSLDITGSALRAQRIRLDVIAANMANSEVTEQSDGTPLPYRRRFVTFMSGTDDGRPGVHSSSVQEDPAPFTLRYAPTHPNRIRTGPLANYVQFPNVNLTLEYVDALEASRAYEMNAAMMSVTRTMLAQAIRLFA